MSTDAIQVGMAPLRSLQTTARFLIYTVTVGKRIVADCFSYRSRREALIRQGQDPPGVAPTSTVLFVFQRSALAAGIHPTG